MAPRLIRICKYQLFCSLFSVLDWKHSFCANLVQKFKIVSLNTNLVLRLIWICRIPWWYSSFRLQTINTLLEQTCSKKLKKNASLSWNLAPRLIRICKIQLLCSFFQLSTKNTLFDSLGKFWANFVKKSSSSL